MANFQDFYEHTFNEMNIGDAIKVFKDGETYKGTLIFKSRDFITVQLPFYREGFSITDFFTGHARLGDPTKEDKDDENFIAVKKVAAKLE